MPFHAGIAPVWGLIWGISIVFNINTSSLRQAIVPNQMLGRVMTIATVLGFSAIPLGSLIGGLVIGQGQHVALVYGVIGACVFCIAVAFSFTAVGHARRYIEEQKAS